MAIKMKTHALKSNIFLLLAAAIWGLAFVAQRVGAEYLGAFTYNGIRFALGSLSLIPLILLNKKRNSGKDDAFIPSKSFIPAGIIAGSILFFGASLQQIGMADTTSGKAAFITGLYIVLVPIFGIFLKQYIHINVWFGVAIAAIGLYLLCVTGDFTISRGDLFQLVGAFFWASHILVIDYFVKKVDILKLSLFQFTTCSILSLIVAVTYESITMYSIKQAAIPLLYGGIFSVGIAYTLQVLGQKHAQPSHAAIILSMETVFASLGGFIILNENLGLRAYIGGALMLAGMLISQLQNFRHKKPKGISQ